MGRRVALRAGTPSRPEVDTAMVEVGRTLESIAPTVLALFHRAQVPELGLRVPIALPAGFAVRPGEQVDVTIRDL